MHCKGEVQDTTTVNNGMKGPAGGGDVYRKTQQVSRSDRDKVCDGRVRGPGGSLGGEKGLCKGPKT